MQAGTVWVDGGGGQVEDVACGGDAAGVLIGASLGVCWKRAVIDSVVVGNRGAVRSLVHVHVLTTRSIPVRGGSRSSVSFSSKVDPLVT